jgi:hypothetical protein
MVEEHQSVDHPDTAAIWRRLPRRTEKYMKKYGAKYALNDQGNEVL